MHDFEDTLHMQLMSLSVWDFMGRNNECQQKALHETWGRAVIGRLRVLRAE